MERRFDAVLYDLTGVITTPPWDAFAAMGEAAGLGREAALTLVVGDYGSDTDHAWHRLERGEIPILEWVREVRAAGERSGLQLDLGLLAGLADSMVVHEEVIDHVRQLRADGYRTGIVTNNVREAGDRWRTIVPTRELFEVVVDSCEEGVRKPDPEIYRRAVQRLGVGAERTVFLDDVPGNVAGAEAAGLTGLLVDSPEQAIRELDALLGRC